MLKKGLKRFFPAIVLVLSLVQMGTIRRDQDPILKAQTDPISLKQKIEETKDGVKGAPAPSFKYYDREDFLTRSPMGTAEEEKVLEQKTEGSQETLGEVSLQEEVSPLEAPLPSEALEEKEFAEEGDWWLEDAAQESSET